MNICIITPRYPYKDVMEYVFVKTLVDEWVKMGHKCVVLTPFSLTSYHRHIFAYKPVSYIDDTVQNNPVQVFNPRYISVPKVRVFGLEINQRVRCELLFRKLRKLNFKPDFIYCHFFRSAVDGWFISRKNNIPLFVATGESKILPVDFPTHGFSLEIFRHSIKGCICVSSKNKEEAINKGLIDEEKCRIFPNGTDLSLFHKKDRNICRKTLGFNSEDFIIICVGGFENRKGQNRIIEAISRLNNPQIKLICIGAGKMQIEHPCVIFKGRVPNRELPNFLNAADVFCLPTLAEGCCNAIVEAVACGLPIISSDLPFNYDILDNSNSILVNPKDITAISDAIETLYNHQEICERLSLVNVERAKSLSIEARSRAIIQFIESAL